jgi:hypothetical protein
MAQAGSACRRERDAPFVGLDLRGNANDHLATSAPLLIETHITG